MIKKLLSSPGCPSRAFLNTICIVFIFFSPEISGQGPREQTGRLNEQLLSEELFIQTDRDIYITGEQVYLRIFCIDRITRKPSGASMVAYISLLDKSNSPVDQVKIKLDGFTGSGYINIPDTLRTGNYLISACTKWMQNFTPELYSYKKISVINPFKDFTGIKMPARDRVPDTVIFYPESGNMISGKEIKLGFRCLDSEGTPVAVIGTVTDSGDSVLCSFRTDKYGNGILKVKPVVNNNLFLNIRGDAGPEKRFGIPAPSETGITFSILTDSVKKLHTIKLVTGERFNAGYNDFFIIYKPVSLNPFIYKLNLFRDRELALRGDDLPAGPALITIADDEGHVYAGRWFYNNRSRNIRYRINLEKQSYSERERIRIDILATDNDGNPVESEIALSVARAFSIDEESCQHENISQLAPVAAGICTGNLSCFNDQLMFLNYKEDSFMAATGRFTPAHLPEPEGHLITGTIRSTDTGEPLKSEAVVLSMVGKVSLCKFSRTDKNGWFSFVTDEEGVHEIVIQPLSSDWENYYAEIDNPFPVSFSKYTAGSFFPDTSQLNDINKAVIAMQVNRIYRPFFQTVDSDNEIIVRNAFYGKPDNSTKMSLYIELTSLSEAIKEIIAGVTTSTIKGRTVLNVINENQGQTYLTNPLVLVDGVPAFSHSKVLNISLPEIDRINAMNSRYVISDIVLDGIIEITTNKGNLPFPISDKPVFRQEFGALQKKTDVKFPDYFLPSDKDSHLPDLRTTLYWNPVLKTDSNGRATVEFYTSDETGDYTILVKGFSTLGADGRAVSHFTVNREK